ncbi:MAG: sialidase family protein [Luteimonas sp.]
MRKFLVLLLPLALAACSPAAQAPPDSSAATVDATRAYVAHDWPLPATIGSGQPDLALTPDGRVLLSWVSSIAGRRNALQFVAMAENGRWQSDARTIVVGDSLMASWANVPHIAATEDGALWVQFMQQRGSGHAGDIALARSIDGGFTWSQPVAVNDTSIEAEHGFAALWPNGRDSVGLAWLDSSGEDAAPAPKRAAMAGHDMADNGMPAHDMHDSGGRTVLRAAAFDMNLQPSAAAVLDHLTCDCCQSEVVLTSQGALLAYRDRTDAEVRDIMVVRNDGKAWGTPVPVHVDGWVMRGCPVNGPAIAAVGNDVVVAWFTEADQQPRVQVARSTNAGASFTAPVVLQQGDAVQGRTAIALDAAQAWILWLSEDRGGQTLWLSRRSPDLAREFQRIEVAKLQGRGRATGYPQIALRNGNAYIAWTDIVDGASHLRGAILTQP